MESQDVAVTLGTETDARKAVRAQIDYVSSEHYTEDLKAIYDRVSDVLRQTIGKEPFTSAKIAQLIAVTIRTIQDVSNSKRLKIPGPEKQAMALSIVKHALYDFYQNGQLPKEVYEDILLTIEITGPLLIDLAVAAWKKGVQIVTDIQDNGCSGCCKRNCVVS